MIRTRQMVRSIFSNWTTLMLSALISFLLSPFVVHKLGNLGYGVWTLVNSSIAYIGLIDLGLRGAVTRYVARYYSSGDHVTCSKTVAAAIWFRVWAAVATVTVALLLSLALNKIFNIPPAMQRSAHIAIIVCGANLAVALLSGIFAAILAALHRFDLISLVTISHTTVRALGIVWLLQINHGIVALASWELCVTLVSGMVLFLLSRKTYPELQISKTRPDRTIFRTVWGYSIHAFIINMAVQIIYYSDTVVIGMLLSATAVTFYAVGGGIIEILRNVISAITTTFAPLASSLQAKDDYVRLRQLLIQGTKFSLLVAFPIATALFFRGPTFISLWMGKQFAVPSGHIIQILLLAQIFAFGNATAGNIVYGLAKHGRVVPWACLEAGLNLVLSIFLARRVGIQGVAWGTVIASWVVHVGFWPGYISKLLSISVWKYLGQGWLKPTLATVPFAAACFVTERVWAPTSLFSFFVEITAILPIFFAAVAILFWKELLPIVQSRATWLGIRNPAYTVVDSKKLNSQLP